MHPPDIPSPIFNGAHCSELWWVPKRWKIDTVPSSGTPIGCCLPGRPTHIISVAASTQCSIADPYRGALLGTVVDSKEMEDRYSSGQWHTNWLLFTWPVDTHHLGCCINTVFYRDPYRGALLGTVVGSKAMEDRYSSEQWHTNWLLFTLPVDTHHLGYCLVSRDGLVQAQYHIRDGCPRSVLNWVEHLVGRGIAG